MTPNRRIALNIIATYGRSLYAMVLGLFTARWVLMSLGKVDYGLIGLIGGLTCFVSFLNNLLASSVGRFYAVSVGAAKKMGNEVAGLEECRKWFNTALTVHSILPLILIVVGYPAGIWAIEHFLEIPLDRITPCVWVWRFTCITCFFTMFNVPFRAMYMAKQEIAELTLYSFIQTTFNAVFIYYMVSHPGFWLTKYAAWSCCIAVIPQLIIAGRALRVYQECKVRRNYLFSANRFRELAYFAVARFWADFSAMFQSQGRAILVNKYEGAALNASMTVGNSISSHALTLSQSLSGAFWPAITNKAGEEDVVGVKKLSFMLMRLSSALVLILAIPLSLEIKEVLSLWLVTPPDFSAEIAVAVLASSTLEQMTIAYPAAIYGFGRGVMKYAWSVGFIGVLSVFVIWAMFAAGYGMWSVVIGLILMRCAIVIVRLHLGRKLIGFSFWLWARAVLLPVGILVVCATIAGALVRFSFKGSFIRIVGTTIACEVVFLPLIWFILFNDPEREFIRARLSRFLTITRK